MEEKKVIKRNHLIISIPLEVHNLIKIKAIEQGITLRAWVMRAIMDKIKKDNQYE